MKTILITGAEGFIGRYAARHFTERGFKVVGVDNAAAEHAALPWGGNYHCMQLPDSTFPSLLRTHKPWACIHCAGSSSVPASVLDPAGDFRANTLLTFEVLEAVRQHAPACRFLLLSSASVYGNPQVLPVQEGYPPGPISPYGFHKLQAEQACREYALVYGLAAASARIFSAYGPGLRRQVLWDITRKALTEPDVLLQGTGGESRDFIHAKDIARGLDTLLEHAPMSGEAYNLASGRETRIADLALLIVDELGGAAKVVFTGELPSGTPKNWMADMSMLSDMGFSPEISMEDGVREFVAWARHELQGG
jgi:UDP-glucose 4-epimerase